MVSAEELGKFIDLFGRAVHEKLSDISAQDFLSFIPNTGFRFLIWATACKTHWII